MNLDLIALDDAIIERLRDQVSALRTVDTMDSEERVLEHSRDPLPAAYTLVNGAVYARELGTSGYQIGNVTITVFVKTRNLRGNGAARKAPDGAYALINHIGDALLGYAPVVCSPLELADIGAVQVKKTAALFAIKFVAQTHEASA